MDDTEAGVAIIQALAWPGTVALAVYYLKNDLFTWLGGRGVTVENQTLGMKIVVGALEKEVRLTSTDKKEIGNLSAHDIWALDTFNIQPIKKYQMGLAQKVIAKTFLEIGLIDFKQDDVVVTQKGKAILEVANKILD
jgi:hypothetical protein